MEVYSNPHRVSNLIPGFHVSFPVRITVPFRQVSVKHFQVWNENSVLLRKHPVHIQFVHPETLTSSRLRALPERQEMPEGKIIIKPFIRVADEKKSNAVLFLESSHEFHLMRMDVLKRESLLSAFLGVKTDRDPLYHAYIVNGTLLVKVGERDMPALAIDLHRRDRRRDFLDERQLLVFVFFICAVDLILEERASQAPRLPCSHNGLLLYSDYIAVYFFPVISL